MNNNDIMRRIRYTFNLNDSKMISVFSSTGYRVTRAQISDWLKKEDDPAFKRCSDVQMALFLNGFINDKRGKREGDQPVPEKYLNNNIIFRKIRIALNLKDEDVLEIINLTKMNVSKHEVSAFFRKPGHKHYRSCGDQMLRTFLKGLQLKYHVDK
jgi:uncharacterized protein YehS (DUF1456 family)